MAKYTEVEVEFGGDKYIFVTRGKAKPFTEDEAAAYLQARVRAIAESSNDPIGEPTLLVHPVTGDEPRVEEEFRIPDDKMRRHLFRKDLTMGMKFCSEKYGASEEAIQKEALRLATRETRRG